MPNADHASFQTLTADEKRALNLSIPILRIADNLDRSHEQRITSLECRVRDTGDVVLQLHGVGDIDLEQWAADRVASLFKDVYGRGISLTRAK